MAAAVATPIQYMEAAGFPELVTFFRTNIYSSVFVLVDENTKLHCYPLVQAVLPEKHLLIEIQSGEKYKTLETCTAIWQQLTQATADRKTLLVNLGGGVISDMGGFAAGCFKRGLDFVNIPTTLLSMVDATVGGKTGVDFKGIKNQLGLFNFPKAIFIHAAFLNTLPDREFKSGYAEMIKHYLIADKASFVALGQTATALPAPNPAPPAQPVPANQRHIVNPQIAARNAQLTADIRKNIAIKTLFVTQDPHETSIRKALNFGHTVGHAVESIFLEMGKDALLHGEAIAIGMICESFISNQAGKLSDIELRSISAQILSVFKLPTLPTIFFPSALQLIKQDKKNEAGIIKMALLKGIGAYSIDDTVTEDILLKSFEFFNQVQD